METMWSGCCEPDGYGELSRESVEVLLETLGFTKTPTDVFFDLGSGVGKIVTHAAVVGAATKAVGVELNTGRHRAAVFQLEAVAKDVPSVADRVTLLNADMLEVDLTAATALYLNHACFPADVRSQITKKILDTAHNVQVIIAAPTMPDLEASGMFKGDPGFLMLPMEIYTYGTVRLVLSIPHHAFRRSRSRSTAASPTHARREEARARQSSRPCSTPERIVI